MTWFPRSVRRYLALFLLCAGLLGCKSSPSEGTSYPGYFSSNDVVMFFTDGTWIGRFGPDWKLNRLVVDVSTDPPMLAYLEGGQYGLRGDVVVRDLRSGELSRQMLYEVKAIKLSPDRTRIAARYDQGIAYWNVNKPARQLLKIETEQSSQFRAVLNWLDDSTLLIGTADGRILAVNVDTGEERSLMRGRWPTLSPNCEWLTYVRGGMVHLVRLDGTGGEIPLYPVSAYWNCLAWNPESDGIFYVRTDPEDVDKIWYCLRKIPHGEEQIIHRESFSGFRGGRESFVFFTEEWVELWREK